MKRFFAVAVALAVPALCVSRAAHAEQKIAYVDMQRALEETEEGKQVQTKLKSDFEKKQKDLDARTNELKKLKEELDKSAPVLKPEVLKQKQAELDQKLQQLQEAYVRMQKEIQEKQATEVQRLLKKMQGVIASIAQIEGVTYVLEKNSGILYAPPSLDLTNELIRKYNAGSGGGSKPSGKK